ncbi:uncharacterized protein JN550_011205 [Neoarthrinium moseri]|uniref:uncharacterized protein n=1 Tax=Neoarthrinium moseri TaxID=1658444 RepID=UPI001FDE004A|nr:uncharacterized protein JN550_011205 [Neoarthrinium moseri]KAI1860890.1 hypothetical protein JN550_011205 [Neoarthrinium moseri]
MDRRRSAQFTSSYTDYLSLNPSGFAILMDEQFSQVSVPEPCADDSIKEVQSGKYGTATGTTQDSEYTIADGAANSGPSDLGFNFFASLGKDLCQLTYASNVTSPSTQFGDPDWSQNYAHAGTQRRIPTLQDWCRPPPSPSPQQTWSAYQYPTAVPMSFGSAQNVEQKSLQASGAVLQPEMDQEAGLHQQHHRIPQWSQPGPTYTNQFLEMRQYGGPKYATREYGERLRKKLIEDGCGFTRRRYGTSTKMVRKNNNDQEHEPLTAELNEDAEEPEHDVSKGHRLTMTGMSSMEEGTPTLIPPGVRSTPFLIYTGPNAVPEPEHERATSFTPSEQLFFPPALLREYIQSQHRWLDKETHSSKTVFVVTHQDGTQMREVRVFSRLKDANLDALSIMQNSHPEFFAVPSPKESEAFIKEEEEPQTLQAIFEREGVKRRLTKGEDISSDNAIVIKEEDGDDPSAIDLQMAGNTSASGAANGTAGAREETRVLRTPDVVDLERQFIYIGAWKFTAMTTLKLTAKLPGGREVKVFSSLRTPREPQTRKTRKQTVRAKAARQGEI